MESLIRRNTRDKCDRMFDRTGLCKTSRMKANARYWIFYDCTVKWTTINVSDVEQISRQKPLNQKRWDVSQIRDVGEVEQNNNKK